MSNVQLAEITAAVIARNPGATPQEHGQMIANVIATLATAQAPTQTAPKATQTARKATATRTQKPKAQKPATMPAQPARKAAAKPQTQESDWRSKPMSRKQRDRIIKVSNEHGFEILDMSKWTAGVASTYYADLKAAI